MDIAWLSANKFGYEVIKLKESGSNEFNINSIITLGEDAKTVMYDGINKNLWKNFGINVYEINDIKEEEELFRKLSPDLVVMCGWRQIIPKSIIDLPNEGIVGFHPTLLPIGRGPAPLINSILNGFKESGLTMFYVNDGLDDGDIIGQEKFNIDNSDHAEDVYNKTIESGKKLIIKYLPLIAKGNAPRIPQDHSKATFFEKPSLKNNKIDLVNESLDKIDRKIKALSKPYKGAYIEQDNKRLILWKSEFKDMKD